MWRNLGTVLFLCNPLSYNSCFAGKLWTSPELLRLHSPPPDGTQKGDVYSFAVICQEIVYRNGPFYVENMELSPQGIYLILRSKLPLYKFPYGTSNKLMHWLIQYTVKPAVPANYTLPTPKLSIKHQSPTLIASQGNAPKGLQMPSDWTDCIVMISRILSTHTRLVTQSKLDVNIYDCELALELAMCSLRVRLLKELKSMGA